MADGRSKKVPLEGMVKIPKWLDQAIAAEAVRRDCFKYEVIADLWRAAEHGGPSEADGEKSAQNMTPKQRRVLAGVLRILEDSTRTGKVHARMIEALVELHPES